MDTTITKLPIIDIVHKLLVTLALMILGSNGTQQNKYVMITWNNSANTVFEMKLLDHNGSWSGRMSNEFAKTFCMDVEPIEEYCANIKRCLSTVNKNCVYEFSDIGDNVAKLTWKKQFEDVTQEYGSVLVYRDTVPISKDTLIDKLIQENEDLNQRVADISTTIETLRYNLKCNQEELVKFNEAKSALETSLYEKFIHLLNAKKQRIKLLEENIGELKVPHDIRGCDCNST